MTRKTLAWFTGLYEGEGSVTVHQSSATLYLEIGQKDKWLCKRLRRCLGGYVNVQRRNIKANPHRGIPKQQLILNVWRIASGPAVWLAMTIYPDLSPRRQKQMRRAFRKMLSNKKGSSR